MLRDLVRYLIVHEAQSVRKNIPRYRAEKFYINSGYIEDWLLIPRVGRDLSISLSV